MKKGIIFLAAVVLLANCDREEPVVTVEKEQPVEKILTTLGDPSAGVMVAAHRGDWQDAPENSLAAFQKCIDMGCDMIEIDLRLTADRQLILMHDHSLERTTNGTGDVVQRPLRYIQSLYLRNKDGELTNEHVPTLGEVLTLVRGKILLVIDKYDYYLPELEAALDRAGMRDHVVILGFGALADTQSQLGPLLDTVHYVPSINKQTPAVEAYIQSFAEALRPAAFGFWYETDDSPLLTYMKNVKKDNRRVWVNTTEEKQCAGHTDAVSMGDPDKGWGTVIRQGADIILTDRPAQLLQYLRGKNLHH